MDLTSRIGPGLPEARVGDLMDSIPASSFATPSRSISREQFQSLRQKMVKESPRLYRNKLLSDPSEKSKLKSHSAPATPRNYLIGSSGPVLREGLNTSDSRSDEVSEDKNSMINNVVDATVAEPGNFENPVLKKLASRTVNKEMETQIIVTNLIVLAIWDLFTKFLKVFLDYSHLGRFLISAVQEKFWKLKLGLWIYRMNRELPWLMKRLSWSNIDTLFHLIVAFNVIGSLWRLFSKIKVNDLDLNRSQKELLGLQSDDEYAGSFATHFPSKKPHVIVDQNKNVSGPRDKGIEASSSTPPTPFLFKSLETPLKAKQRQQNQQQQQQRNQVELQRQTQSAAVSRVNVFGSNFGKIESKPVPWTTSHVGPAGYIPSSKYAYMMSSPSPRKRM